MRDFVGIPYASLPEVRDPDFTYRLKNMLAQLDVFGRDASQGFALIQQGFSPIAGGTTPLVDLTNFFYLPGRSGGQVGYGDVVDSGTLTLSSTSSSTKGKLYLGSSLTQVVLDETQGLLGMNTAAPAAAFHVVGSSSGAGDLIVPTSDISSLPDGWAPSPGNYYSGAGPSTIAGSHFSALASDDGLTSFLAINTSVGNGSNPDIVGLSANILAGRTYTITASVFSLFGATLVTGSNFRIDLVDSGGLKYSSNSLDLVGVSTTPVTVTLTVTTTGSNGTGTANSMQLHASPAGNRYICVSYVVIATQGGDIVRWDTAGGVRSGRIDSSGHAGIGTGSTSIAPMLSVLSDSAATTGLLVTGVVAQTADVAQLVSGIASTTSTTWNQRGVYATGRVKTAVLFTDDNATIASAKLLGFDVSGITAGQTRTLTIPNASGTISLIDLAQTWTALQTFKDTTFLVGDDGDVTKSLVFSLGGATAAKKMTLISSHTLDRSITLPNVTGSLPTLENAHTITGAWRYDAALAGVPVPVTVGVSNIVSYTGTGLLLDDNSGFFGELQTQTPGLTGNRFYSFPDGSGQVVIGGVAAVLVGAATSTFTSNTAGSGASFSDLTVTSKKLRFVLSGAVGSNSITLANTAARNYGLGNLAGNIVIVGDDPPAVASGALGKEDLTAQAADITSVNLSNTPPAGLYMVEAYLVCTALDAGAGTATLTLGWTDVLGATTDATVTKALTSTGRSKAIIPMQVSSGNITYTITGGGTYGTARYALYLRVLALG